MPKNKIKTRKAAAKRFRFTGTGKIVRRKAYKRHILESKTSKQKRRLSKDILVSKSDEHRVRSMLAGQK
ncbi:MAG: 50S ribosomal protein L35 [Candidatus Saganbacteria bacterium]|nr:50S ribosomal protein L35 [Candidatus Saganbacteria bacterium]